MVAATEHQVFVLNVNVLRRKSHAHEVFGCWLDDMQHAELRVSLALAIQLPDFFGALVKTIIVNELLNSTLIVPEQSYNFV